VEVNARLGIGRDAAFSPIAANLGEFVSRRHAEVLLECGKLFVRHLGQTNPTYVNGRKLGDSEQTELVDGDELGFSTQEIAVVRIGART
jgi:pSer/pThr/pTyr-binding forkhead associated (FHA) protein